MKFQATLYALAGVVATTLAAGVIEQDIQTMILHTTTFDHDVIQFSRGPLPRLALSLHEDAYALGFSIDQGTMDLNALSKILSDGDAESALDAYQGFESSSKALMQHLVEQKDIITSSLPGVDTSILADLKFTESSASAFAASLSVTVSDDYHSRLQVIHDSIIAAYDATILAYTP